MDLVETKCKKNYVNHIAEYINTNIQKTVQQIPYKKYMNNSME
jgi:hypothetical protein